MKMYKKSDLTLVDGMLVTEDGDIVIPDIRIIDEANALETMVQKKRYMDGQPEAVPAPSLEGFERISNNDVTGAFVAKTPMLDSKAEEALKIMEELDAIATTEKANEMHSMFEHLIQFVRTDYVIDTCSSFGVIEKFDMPLLGNPLELTVDDVADAIAYCNGIGNLRIRHDDEAAEEE